MVTCATLQYTLEERDINQMIFAGFIEGIYYIRYFIALLRVKYLTKNVIASGLTIPSQCF